MYELEEVKILIVDPDYSARERLRRLATRQIGVSVVAECARASDVPDLISCVQADLIFMELELPDLNALTWLEQNGSRGLPPVAITSTYGRGAARALDLHAIDYLLKPVSAERVRRTLDRYRAHRGSAAIRTMDARLEKALRTLGNSEEYLDRITVPRRRGSLVFVDIASLEWIEAAGNYLRLNTRDGSHLVRQTMASLERRLDPRKFIRIHRSTIVNIGSIREVRQRQSGEQTVVLASGKRLNIGRSYRDRFARLLGQAPPVEGGVSGQDRERRASDSP